jgi:hypothetical protein
MLRVGFVLLVLVLLGCKGKKAGLEEEGFSYEAFSKKFHAASVPYDLKEIDLLKHTDTATIRPADLNSFIPDSLRNKLFGKGNKVKYSPIAKIQKARAECYYIIKATSGNKRDALLLTFDKEGKNGSVLPFLIPDNDPSTKQSSVIDKTFSISRNINQKKANDVLAEGKDVYVYNSGNHNYSLIMTDALNEGIVEVINPIDSLSHKHKLSGDYYRNKRNFVSIRDGQYPNQLIAFVHFEKDNGTCTGELKGVLLVTSPSSAIYRQGGDPCVLNFRFTQGSVTLREDRGCGSHRGVDCVFDGTFRKKKESKVKQKIKKKP